MARNDTNGVEAVKVSKERLLNSKLVRQALELVQETKTEDPGGGEPAAPEPTTPTAPAALVVEVGDYKFYPQGNEPPLSNLQALRLEFPSTERRAMQFFYDLRASVVMDKSMRTTTARITVTAKNRDIPADSKLVLEYFSRGAGRMISQYREKTEQIPLPKIARGQAFTVDSQGLSLGRYFRRHGAGREFYGLIVSLFDSGGKLLYQQCGPPTLGPQCSDKPTE